MQTQSVNGNRFFIIFLTGINRPQMIVCKNIRRIVIYNGLKAINSFRILTHRFICESQIVLNCGSVFSYLKRAVQIFDGLIVFFYAPANSAHSIKSVFIIGIKFYNCFKISEGFFILSRLYIKITDFAEQTDVFRIILNKRIIKSKRKLKITSNHGISCPL